MPEFPCPSPITVDLRLAAGSVEIHAEPRDTATVEVAPYDDSTTSRQVADQTRVELSGDTLVIAAPDSGGWAFRWRGPRLRVTARVPDGSIGRLRVATADVSCHGEWSQVKLNTASGDAYLERATGDVTMNTASGDVRVGQVGGQLTVRTASGDVSARRAAGSVEVTNASGKVQLDDAGGDVSVRTASGDATIGVARHGTVRAHTVSGDVSVGVATGTGVWLDLNTLSGRTTSDLNMGGEAPPAGHDLTVLARTVSGSVDVHRVAVPTSDAVYP